MSAFLIAAAKAELDPEIEELDVPDRGKKAAGGLKKKRPAVTFTRGHRDGDDQLQAKADHLALTGLKTFCGVSFLLVAPLCTAQRMDEPSATAEINAKLQKEGLSAVQKKAEGGDARAELQLALGYIAGGLLPKDDKLGATWCSKAAHQGFEAAVLTMKSHKRLRTDLNEIALTGKSADGCAKTSLGNPEVTDKGTSGCIPPSAYVGLGLPS